MQKPRAITKYLNVPGLAAAFVLLFFSFLMGQIIYPYLIPPFPTDIDFLMTKQAYIGNKLYMSAFYTHITSSLIVLLLGLTQFSKLILIHYPKIHALLGKLSVILVLGLSAPSGFIMSFYGNGGIPAEAAFLLLSVSWWLFTFKAWRLAEKRNWNAHGEWMLRSFALTFSAVSLRVYVFILGSTASWHGLTPVHQYITVSWMGWVGNLLIAEFLISKGYIRYMMRA